MLIANPIYDVFFKYLMEDIQIVKKLLSTIIGEEIIALELRPQETTVHIPQYFLSVIRLDFKASIKTANGQSKKVLIELQKGKFAFDIARFRKYLGENYAKQDLITIYFLGFQLENLQAAVVKANHQYYDMVKGETLNVKNDFIEQLVHDCFVIQIPRLTLNLQNKVEKMLLIFNQQFVLVDDSRKLLIPYALLADVELKELVERLSRPLMDDDLLRIAEAEDEVVEKLDEMSRQMEEKDKKIEEKDKKIDELLKELSRLKGE